MGEDKAGFSARLRAALRDKGMSERPRDLMAKFNSRYPGPSVTFQATSAWLLGKSIPRYDKVSVLAELLGITPEHLLFGPSRARGVRDAAPAWPDMDAEDRDVISRYLAMPVEKKRAARTLIVTLDELSIR